MKKIITIKELQSELQNLRNENKSIGFVPTMGALHEGHLSLVRECAGKNDICVVSIFVNPTQFNDPKDLERYPRTLEADSELLEKEDCTILFAPDVNEMYPEPDTRIFSFNPLDEVMEGVARPGHFNGVAQIVSKLFDIVKPDRAYFGEKDFQQVAIIREMVKQLNMPVKIISCPILREPDGLAMSSRNTLLNEEERKKAVRISQSLFKSTNFVPEKTIEEVRQYVTDTISEEPVLQPEYFEIVDGYSLQPVINWNDSSYIVGCITVYCGKIRLIDNIVYRKEQEIN